MEGEKELRGIIEMTSLELAELHQLKSVIMAEAGEAKGKEAKFKWKTQLLKAGIPHIYWDLELNQFEGDKKAERIVLNYIGMLKEAYQAGQGVLFTGKHGVGKTMLACIIGKEALRQGYTAKYISMAGLLDRIMAGFGDDAVKEQLATVVTRIEFLIIDDFGKEYRGIGGKLNPMITLELDRILRARINIGRVTIGTTNYPQTELVKVYGDSVYSVLQGYVQTVEVTGHDFREARGREFRKKMEDAA